MAYENFKKWVSLINETEDRDELLNLWEMVKDLTPIQFGLFQKKFCDENKPENVIHQLFTFTTDPVKQNENAQEAYIKSIVKRKDNLKIKSLWYCKEHADTNLHFHVGISSTKSIPPDAFKQYKTSFGSVHKSKKISSDSQGMQDYLSKETTSIKLL